MTVEHYQLIIAALLVLIAIFWAWGAYSRGMWDNESRHDSTGGWQDEVAWWRQRHIERQQFTDGLIDEFMAQRNEESDTTTTDVPSV